MSEERQPGQHAYETWGAAMDAQGVGCDVWSDQPAADQAAWAAVEASAPDRDALAALAAGWHGAGLDAGAQHAFAVCRDQLLDVLGQPS